ncbi:hypothetical protein AgCh_024582 [Apium graveolens]
MMKEVSKPCYEWLMDKPRGQWSREIHKAVMKRIQVRRDKMKDIEFVICPSAKKIDKLYSYTLEPIVGPEFWEDTPEPLPLPPLIKVQTGRPKKKRNKKNDIPKDATKLPKFGAKLGCSYCKDTTHNHKKCTKKRDDEIAKAIEENRAPNIGRTKDKVKTKVVEGEAFKENGKRLANEALKIRGKEVTTLRELEAAKRAKQSDSRQNQQGPQKLRRKWHERRPTMNVLC